MAMGRQKDGQGDLMVSWSEMPRSPGHVFYDRLQSVLIEGGFDAFAEASCRPYYAARMGAPSVPPGRYFRMHLVGYFEGIDSERGLEWRCSIPLAAGAAFRRRGPSLCRRVSARKSLGHTPPGPAPAASGRSGTARSRDQTSVAPVGTRPVTENRQSAMSSLLASATIITRRIRPRDPAVRSLNHLLSALSG